MELIETAPRDGTPILAWKLGMGWRETRMMKYAQGSPGYEKWSLGDGPLNAGWEWVEPYGNWLKTWEPTHWLPLPTPPV